MLKNLIRKKIDSSDPKSRIIALNDLDLSQPDSVDTLHRVVSTDPEVAVRLAAIARVDQLATLFDLTGDSDVQVAAAASSRLEQLLAGGKPETAELDQVLQNGNTRQLQIVASHSTQETVRQRAVASIQDQAVLARIAAESPFHNTRQVAAERVTDPEHMQHLLGEIRSRDKQVARLLQERLQKVREEQKQREEHAQAIQQLLDSIRELAGSVWSPQYNGQFTALTERWSRLVPAPLDSQQLLWQADHAVCAKQVEAHRERDLALSEIANAKRLQQDTLSAIEDCQADSVESFEQITALHTQSVESRNTANTLWQTHRALATPSQSATREFEQADSELQAWIRYLDALKTAEPVDNWIDNKQVADCRNSIAQLKKAGGVKVLSRHPDNPLLQTGNTLIQKLSGFLDSKLREDSQSVDSVRKLLGALSATIGQGKWSPANNMYQRAEKKLAGLAGHSQHARLADSLAKQKKRLDELADWQDFAARPKFESLCEAMQNLAENPLPAEEQSVQIKKLRQQWKALGPGRCSNEMWPVFREAADKAYIPVGEWRHSLEQERDKKRNAKAAICDELETSFEATDWDAPDWRNIEKRLRQARNDWRRNRIADRKPIKELEQRFSDVIGRFEEKLSVEYAANVERKDALIVKATALAEADITQHSVNQARSLQSSWKQIGITRRKEDQALWERFNEQCRKIHQAHRDQQREKTRSELSHVHEARDLIKTMERLCKEGKANDSQFGELQERFNALPEFPDRDRKFLFRDFNRVVNQFGKLRDKQSRDTAQAELAELQRKSDLCARYEQLAAAPDADSETPHESAKGALDNEWAESAVELPRDWHKSIEARRQLAVDRIHNKTVPDFTEAASGRRMLCIQAEILNGRETPEEDRQARMNWQLEQLQSAIATQAMTDPAKENLELRVKWWCAPGTDATQQQQLETRFATAAGYTLGDRQPDTATDQ